MIATDEPADAGTRIADRRRMIAAGIVAAAGAIVGGRTSPAAATTPPTTPPATGGGSEPSASAPAESAPPTTAPGRPTAADVELLRPLQSAELAAKELYRAAGADDPVLGALAESHQAYADVLAALLGGSSERDDTLYEERLGDFESSDVAAVSSAGYELESALVSTHADVLGQLEAIDGATTLASILIVESRHCAVLADLSGRGDDLDALLINRSPALTTATGV